MALQDDRQPQAVLDPMVFYEDGPKAGQPGFNSTKVGFTLRNSRGRIVEGFAWVLNPQGITRALSSRSTVHATKGGFYVDSFGPGPDQINVRQLVASGKQVNRPGSDQATFTAREDVQRFLKRIYLPAVNDPREHRVYFHDSHFERGFEERVWFPPSGLTIQRAVDLNNVWLVEFQMVGLEKRPYAEVKATPIRSTDITRRYVVRKGDTLTKVALRLAAPATGRGHGRQAIVVSDQTLERMIARILNLNPQLKTRRTIVVDGQAHTGQPRRLVPGEIIVLPR